MLTYGFTMTEILATI